MPGKRTIRKCAAACGLACAVLLAAATARAANWSWELPTERYQRLSVFERAQYDKAAREFKDRGYKAAAAEFEKFKIQFPDSPELPYILFMIGYSYHENKERYRAIQIYNEVLDYFGDVVDDAAAALYMLGIATIENGDVREGMLYLQEMVNDDDYRTHPLAAGALRRLADNEWKNQNPEGAVRYWKQVVRDFAGANQEEARIARENVTGYYIRKQAYDAYEDWLIDAENRDDAEHRRWMAQHAWHQAYYNFRYDWGKYTNFNRDQKQADMQAFYDYFQRQRPWYEARDDLWGYLHNALLFASHRLEDRAETKRLLGEVVPLSKEIEDEQERNRRFAWLADRLREGRDFDQAAYCVTFMTDPPYATYTDYQILAARGKWREGAQRLEQIEGMGDQEWARRALRERARVFKDVLHEHETAIGLYRQLNEPPGTLWAIQDCYRAWGKLDQALQVLSEIEGSFPDDAANAAWHKARYLDESGQTEKAVAMARRVLKVYPKSPASSQAHQMLEKYGVDTGGGMADAE